MLKAEDRQEDKSPLAAGKRSGRIGGLIGSYIYAMRSKIHRHAHSAVSQRLNIMLGRHNDSIKAVDGGPPCRRDASRFPYGIEDDPIVLPLRSCEIQRVGRIVVDQHALLLAGSGQGTPQHRVLSLAASTPIPCRRSAFTYSRLALPKPLRRPSGPIQCTR